MAIPMLFDLYALAEERSLPLAYRFLDEWAPGHKWTSAEIAIPTGGDRLFHSADVALAWLIANPAATQTLYWDSRRDDHITHVMLGFSSDGQMIGGLGAWFDEPMGWSRRNPTVIDITALLARLAESVKGRFGYVAFAEPPVQDGSFIAECGRRELAMVEGSLRP